MSERKLHADFEAAPEERRWTGKLAELGQLLRDRAYKLRGEWAWVVLPNGALVCLRIREDDFLKEVRIARREAPTTEKGWAAWIRELDTFAEHLDLAKWVRMPTDGKAEAFFLEHKPLSTVPRAEQPESCSGGCGKAGMRGMYKHFTCNDCALKAGRQEAADNTQRNLRLV